jgi:hypothetical protein
VKHVKISDLFTHPFNHIPHGSSSLSLAPAVNEPFSFSNAQKNSVSLGWPARWTGIFPAQFRGRLHVILGNGSVTSKSMERVRMRDKSHTESLTVLPRGTIVSSRHVRINLGKGTWETVATIILCPTRTGLSSLWFVTGTLS